MADPMVMRPSKLYLFSCSTGSLESFRLAELDSIAKLYNIPFEYYEQPDTSRPYMIVALPGEREARLMGSRLISVKHIWELWAQAETYDELHEKVKEADCRALWEPYAADRDCTWKFTVAAHYRTIPLPVQVKIINTFSYMPFLGNIDLKKPKLEIGVFEEYHFDRMRGLRVKEAREKMGITGKGKEKDGEVWADEAFGGLRGVWMGRKICDSQRHLMDVFDLKKRAYIGTTSMESEASLLMANQALAAPGKWVYDPFAGTGSMLLTSAAFGAMTFGSDIDGRQMRGKIISQQHPFRVGELFDAIVTDPPYGVRAGAKRLGREEGAREVLPTIVPGRENEGYHHQFADYVPPSVGWPMEEVISTLVTFSLYMLKPGGRLVFFLPTNEAEYSDVDVPLVPGLRLISNTSQSFGKWARRLITMEKEDGDAWKKVIDGLDRGIGRNGMRSTWEEEQAGQADAQKKRPGHADFNRRYFEGFKEVQEGVEKLVFERGDEDDVADASKGDRAS
ncbi:SPOSA6832_04905 [Sporobolomyces salmonicolor]|uniref:tRNA (guanine(10)-N(2))-methyltransferase n=1 Tax=Sporidiobolus salmonicolor TaxID=5005 RepID=A0A0D6ET42_SPOSA|nr:SPOSA6832_04905 [Sporobolomyces salmonicolor]